MTSPAVEPQSPLVDIGDGPPDANHPVTPDEWMERYMKGAQRYWTTAAGDIADTFVVTYLPGNPGTFGRSKALDDAWVVARDTVHNAYVASLTAVKAAPAPPLGDGTHNDTPAVQALIDHPVIAAAIAAAPPIVTQHRTTRSWWSNFLNELRKAFP